MSVERDYNFETVNGNQESKLHRLEEVSLTTLLELVELKPNANNLVNLDCDGDEKSSLRLPIITM